LFLSALNFKKKYFFFIIKMSLKNKFCELCVKIYKFINKLIKFHVYFVEFVSFLKFSRSDFTMSDHN
jgi:hypothetical protein